MNEMKLVFHAGSIFEKGWSVSQRVTRFLTFFDLTSTAFNIFRHDFDELWHNYNELQHFSTQLWLSKYVEDVQKCRGHFVGGGPHNAPMRWMRFFVYTFQQNTINAINWVADIRNYVQIWYGKKDQVPFRFKFNLS